MPHFPWPFFRASRSAWFVEVGKKQIPLGKHPHGSPPPKKGADKKWVAPKEIMDAYRKVMATEPEPAPGSTAPRADGALTVAQVLDEYLGWLRQQPHKAKRTVEWYETYLQSFLDSLVDQLLPIEGLQARHVTRWLALHPG
jgi:hypothetical protein